MKWDWLSSNFSRLVELGIAHANLAWPPILLALLVALPIGWVAHRYRRIREIVVGVSSALYIIPSLALFILLPLVIGTSVLSSLNVIIAMTLYGLALQVRSTADSFDTVPAAVASAATAMGYSPLQRVFQVELPLQDLALSPACAWSLPRRFRSSQWVHWWACTLWARFLPKGSSATFPRRSSRVL